MDLLYDLWYRFCMWCEWLFGEPPEMPEPIPLDPREKIHDLEVVGGPCPLTLANPLAIDIAELSKVIYYYRPKAKLP